MILDRFSDGLGAVLVVGDMLVDIDEFYTVAKQRDGYPCLRQTSVEIQSGGAGGVAELVRKLGADCLLACDYYKTSVKRRIIVDGKVLCRLDSDQHTDIVVDLPPAEVCLVADYGKGVVTDELMDRLAGRYKEIIVDRPNGDPFPATAVKSSQSFGPSSVPLIQTLGENGILLTDNGVTVHMPAEGYDWDDHSIVDPCCAGDAVLATLGVARLRGMSWISACLWANINAAKVCQVWGYKPVVFEPLST